MRSYHQRRVKIVCTLGPSSKTLEQISALIEEGMDVARLNFSHGTHEFHRGLIQNIREAAKRAGKPVAIIQTAFFAVYAFASYLFLDARLTAISCPGILLPVALLLMAAGLALVLLSMPFLGRRSFGMQTGVLHTSGIYRFSRNPQLVGSFLFIVGYALLWPAWSGLLWAAIWLPVAHLMVRAEEEHLARIFGPQYDEYRRRTPRYIGLPK